MNTKNSFITLSALIIVGLACKKATTSTPSTPSTPSTVPDVYKKIYGASSITSDGSFVTIKSNGTPDHKSAYYATTNPLYEAFTGVTFAGKSFVKNPNSINTLSIQDSNQSFRSKYKTTNSSWPDWRNR
jgi:hypothetical protein